MAANSVASGVIVARVLGAEGLGALAVLNVAVITTVQIASLGVPTANTYFTAQNRKMAAPAAVNSALFALVSGGGFAFCLWLLAVWQPGWLANLPDRLVAIAVVALPFQLATLIALNFFLALGRVRQFNALDLFGQSFVIINAVVVLLILQRGLWTLVTMNAAAVVGVSLIICSLLYRFIAREPGETRGRWRPDFSALRKTLGYALKGHIQWVSTLLVWRVDLLIVTHWSGAAEAGVYSVATQVTLFLLLVPGVVSQILLARVVYEKDTAARLTCQASRHTALIMFAACLASVPLSYVLPLLYGDAFADVPFLVWLLLPGVFFMSLQAVLVQYFVGTGLPKIIPAMWVATLILNVSLNIVFVPRYAARGAALVSTVCYTLIFVAVFIYFRRRTGHRLSDILICDRTEIRHLLAFRPFQKY